ncbi:hypothetical protein C8R43DRAFT_889949, partial [Mycena crocata]
MLGPDEEAALWDASTQEYSCILTRRDLYHAGNDILSEQDRDNIRAFRLKMICTMPHLAFTQMRYAFRHKLEISSHWVMIHRVAILSGIEPQWFHCCVNSCMAYTGDDTELTHCKICDEARFASDDRPRRLFCYLPIIPRLQGYFMSPKKIQQVLYRHIYKQSDNSISDIFDAQHYKDLCKTKVMVDGVELSHCYFSGKFDIALSVCTDSYLLFERRRK